jgi:hypothetical protein
LEQVVAERVQQRDHREQHHQTHHEPAGGPAVADGVEHRAGENRLQQGSHGSDQRQRGDQEKDPAVRTQIGQQGAQIQALG